MDKMQGCGIIIVLLVASLSLAGASASDKASFEGLDSSKSANGASYAYAISADGSVVVGITKGEDGQQAFQLKDSETSKLGCLDNDVFPTKATAVSADGSTIVGNSGTSKGARAFVLRNGSMTELGQFDSKVKVIESYATSVSADGSVVAGYLHYQQENFTGHEAFRWSENKAIGLGDLTGNTGHSWSKATDVSADGSVTVGFAYNGKRQEAFRWKDGTFLMSKG